jgi:hypothetical protein
MGRQMRKPLTIVMASVFIFLFAIVFRSSRWKTIRSASGREAETLQEKHAFLHAHGFRCRLRADESHPAAAGAGIGPGSAGIQYPDMVLQVHEEDVNHAAQALQSYEKERRLTGSSRVR